MWIERPDKKSKFINDINTLDKQVLLLRGARQVGKTSFVLNAFKEFSEHPQIKMNLLYPSSFTLEGVEYLGRDFFGDSPTGEIFLKNIQLQLGNLSQFKKPVLVFVDEADRFPPAMESIQTLAEFSDRLKFVFTGSQLENIQVQNAATGRKKYFDLYPITFREFLKTHSDPKLADYYNAFSVNDPEMSSWAHGKLSALVETHIRLGGLPRILTAYFEGKTNMIPEIIRDLAYSIEENVKTVLGEKSSLYEYEDVLRKLAFLSMNTLKLTHLQVKHAGRAEAKKLVNKTVGARVAHKIRLIDSESDLSKYLIADCGLVNYLLQGSHLLQHNISPSHMAILHETFVGNELISGLVSREDLFYWKSGNKAEVEFFLRSPVCLGIDVKTNRGDNKSLNSLALLEPSVTCLVKIGSDKISLNKNYKALLPNAPDQRTIPLLKIPHYFTSRLLEFTTPTL